MKSHLRVLSMLLCLAAAPACAPDQDPPADADDTTIDAVSVPEGPLPGHVVPVSCHLELEIIPDAPRFRGRVAINLHVNETLDRFWMHGDGLDVTSAALLLPDGDRIPAEYRQVHPHGIVRVVLAREVEPGDALLEIEYSGNFSESTSGLFRIERGGDKYVFSDFEPITARRAFPGFDEPRFKIPFQIEITTRSDYTALSNGPVIGEDDLGDGLKRVRFSATRPLSPYLVAFAVGPLDVVEGPPVPPNPWRQHPLPLRGVAARGQGPGLDFALANTGVMVDALESYFGLAYPFEKLDLVAVPGYSGAMENAGLIFYGEDLLLLDDRASHRQLEAFGATNAHELAHQWLGDLVTMAWWDDLWLAEASADWMAGKIMTAWRPDLHYDRAQQAAVYRAMDEDSLASARSIREPVTDAAGMFAAFDNLTYVKGAAILRMLENYLGEEVFRDAWRLHLQSFADGTSTVFDFIASLDQVAGDDKQAGEIFRSFLFQPGVPNITVSVQCAQEAAVLNLVQQRYLPLGEDADATGHWSVPVCMRWDRAGSGHGAGDCVIMSDVSLEMNLGPDCPGWIMPNRAAAGYYRWSIDPGEYMPLDGASRELDDREGMSLADSLAAGVNAGGIGAGEYLAAIPDLAAALERSVSMAPVPELRRMFEYLVGEDDQDMARAYLGAIYQRRLEFLDRPGGAEAGSERSRFRSELITFLAEVVREPTLRTRLAEQAAAYAGYPGDGMTHEQALPADLVRTALSIGVQDIGEGFFDHLIGLLEQETSQASRTDILTALGSPRQPLLLARARNLLLDETVRDNEVPVLLWSLTRPPRTTGSWDWFRGNHAALMDRLPEWYRWTAPSYFGALCEIDRVSQLEHVFGPYKDSVPGIAASLEQARQQVSICEAYRSRHAGEVSKFFRSLAVAGPAPGNAAFAAGDGGG